MRVWVDDIRIAPKGWIWVKTVREAMICLGMAIENNESITFSLDHDSGEYYGCGGDYINILKSIELMDNLYPSKYDFSSNILFHLHSANPVGVENMRNIIRHNGWKEIYNL